MLAASVKNMRNAKCRAFGEARVGRGTASKSVVAGAEDQSTDKSPRQGFLRDRAEPGATLYTDEHGGFYVGMPEYDPAAINHSVSEYVPGMAHRNGMESFRSMPQRGYQGTFHHFSVKYLQRYVNEFATRQGLRPQDTEAMMAEIAARMIGRLTYARLTS